MVLAPAKMLPAIRLIQPRNVLRDIHAKELGETKTIQAILGICKYAVNMCLSYTFSVEQLGTCIM